MWDPAAAAAPYDPNRYQHAHVALAARLAARYGHLLHHLDAPALAARDWEFAAIWRHGSGEAEAEEVLCRALEMDEVRQP